MGPRQLRVSGKWIQWLVGSGADEEEELFACGRCRRLTSVEGPRLLRPPSVGTAADE